MRPQLPRLGFEIEEWVGYYCARYGVVLDKARRVPKNPVCILHKCPTIEGTYTQVWYCPICGRGPSVAEVATQVEKKAKRKKKKRAKSAA